jgi:hypothetical protein
MKPRPAKPSSIIAHVEDLRLKTTLPDEYVIGILSLVIRNVRYLVPDLTLTNGKK